MKYIVLLRGINISGKNKISMSELKVELSKFYEDVITYINSGNIILNSNKTESDIITDINMIIKNKFNLDIPIFVIKYEDLVDIIDNSPDWWGTSDKKIYDNLIFMDNNIDFKTLCSVVGKPTPNIDKIKNYKNVVFWSFSLDNYRKSTWWCNSASTRIRDNITIRTCNTIRKLIELGKIL